MQGRPAGPAPRPHPRDPLPLAPLLLLPLLLVASQVHGVALALPQSRAGVAGVAGGAGALEQLQAEAERGPASASGSAASPFRGTIREALHGGVIEPGLGPGLSEASGRSGLIRQVEDPREDGPRPTPASAPPPAAPAPTRPHGNQEVQEEDGDLEELRDVSQCPARQVCVRAELCPGQGQSGVLFMCAPGRFCCPKQPQQPQPPPAPVTVDRTPLTQPLSGTPPPPVVYPPPPPASAPAQGPRPGPGATTSFGTAEKRPQTQGQAGQTQGQGAPGPGSQAQPQRPRPVQPTPSPPPPPSKVPDKPSPSQSFRPSDDYPSLDLLPDTETCGIVPTEDRITNGKNASPGQFPWMVLLGYRRRGDPQTSFLCGGTLINDRYVLTAAHCFVGQNRLVKVRLGELNLTTPIDCDHENVCAPAPEDIEVEGVIAHPRFNHRTIKHDIALVRLKRNITEYSEYIRPICLPISVNVTDDVKFKIAGWGKINFKDKSGSESLQFTDVSGVEPAECNSVQPPELRPLEPGQLCAGGDKGKDACKGDSGGPLMVTLLPPPARAPPGAPPSTTAAPGSDWDIPPHHVTYQVGVVSYGPDSPCGTAPLPSIYTRVSTYMPWILSNIRP